MTRVTRQGVRDLGGGKPAYRLVRAKCEHSWVHADRDCVVCDDRWYGYGGRCNERCQKCGERR